VSFNTAMGQMTEMSRWPKCPRKKWPKCLNQKKQVHGHIAKSLLIS